MARTWGRRRKSKLLQLRLLDSSPLLQLVHIVEGIETQHRDGAPVGRARLVGILSEGVRCENANLRYGGLARVLRDVLHKVASGFSAMKLPPS